MRHIRKHRGGDVITWSEVGESGSSMKPKFHPKQIRQGRWTIEVTTAKGVLPVGNFASEDDALYWIATKSYLWPTHAEKTSDPQIPSVTSA